MNVKRPDRIYKSDRLNYIVDRMRVRQDITPAALAEELRVSERTVYRDLLSLERGQALKKRYSRREGRYLLENELHLPPLTLTPSEALALYTAASNPSLIAENSLAADLRAGLDKIGNALLPHPGGGPDGNAERATYGSLNLTVESIQRPMMEMIRRALRSNRKIRLRYWSSAGDGERQLAVAPYDLRFMHGGWYLLALSEEYGGVRPFKLGRIRAVEILPERFRFPRRFSADDLFAKAWETHGGKEEEVEVRIRFAPAMAAHVMESSGRQFATMEKQADNSLVCTCLTHSFKDLTWWALSYGASAEVLSPPELRAQFVQIAKEMTLLYTDWPAK